MEVFKEEASSFTKSVKDKIEKNIPLAEEDLRILFLLNIIEEENNEK